MSKEEPTFEQAYARLEQVVRQLEGAPLGLDEALKLYEEGMASLKNCQRLLAAAEKRIELLTGVSDDGAAETVPFEDEAGELHEKVGRRSGKGGAAKRDSKASKGKSKGDESEGSAADDVADATMDDGELLF